MEVFTILHRSPHIRLTIVYCDAKNKICHSMTKERLLTVCVNSILYMPYIMDYLLLLTEHNTCTKRNTCPSSSPFSPKSHEILWLHHLRWLINRAPFHPSPLQDIIYKMSYYCGDNICSGTCQFDFLIRYILYESEI